MGALDCFALHYKEPFSDPRVRKAIYLALDRQQINTLVMDGTGGATTIFAPGMAHSAEEAATWPGLRPKDTPGGQEDPVEGKMRINQRNECGCPLADRSWLPRAPTPN